MINFFSDSRIVITQRASQAFFGFLTALLLIKYVPPRELGFYYAFVNLVSIYSFLDFGLVGLLVQISSRYFSLLSIRRVISGARESQDFLAIMRWLDAYYTKLAFIFLLLIPIGILYFISSKSNQGELFWIEPWVVLVIFVSFSIRINPMLSVLEGIGKIRETYLLRFLAVLSGSLISWILIVMGHPLFAAGAMPASLFLLGYIVIKRNYSFIFFQHKSKKNSVKKKWKTEIFSQQLKNVPIFIASNLFLTGPTLIAFYLNGPEIAGRLGLTLVFFNMISLIASSSITSKIPRITKLISINSTRFAINFFLSNFNKTLLFNFIGYLIFILIITYMNHPLISNRFLEAHEMLLIAISSFINQLIYLLNVYFRSKATQIMVWQYFLSTLIGLILGFYFGQKYGSFGILASMALIYCVICLPFCYIFFLKIVSQR